MRGVSNHHFGETKVGLNGVLLNPRHRQSSLGWFSIVDYILKAERMLEIQELCAKWLIYMGVALKVTEHSLQIVALICKSEGQVLILYLLRYLYTDVMNRQDPYEIATFWV
jgi:hypothetical protein